MDIVIRDFTAHRLIRLFHFMTIDYEQTIKHYTSLQDSYFMFSTGLVNA